MGATKTFTANSTDTAIVSVTACRKITIGEDPSVASWPTTAYNIKVPNTGAGARRRPAGVTHEFSREKPQDAAFQAGEIIGYVSIVTGASTTFFQEEQ